MIVEAKPEHAQIVCDVIRQSIQRLCVADHNNDPGVLEPWLSNKTPENCELWINDENSRSFVAMAGDSPIGVSQIGRNGYIYLCYLHPDRVGTGIGKQLLSACETQALSWGLKEITVDSSNTARTFYEAQGFKPSGAPFTEDNLRSFPLTKQLRPG